MNLSFLLQDTGSIYGAEQATLDLAQGLQALPGYRPHFILVEETRLRLECSPLRDALARHQLRYDVVTVTKRFSRALIEEITSRLDEQEVQILHTVGYKADLHGGLATGWGTLIPVVSTVHGWLFRPDLKEQFYGWLNLRALRRFSRVVTLSRHYEQFLLAKGIRRERLVRIPSGFIAPPDSQPVVRGDTSFTVGIMGRLSWEKNHDLFLRALRVALDRGVPMRAVVAGDGPEQERLRRLCRELRLEKHVDWLGYVPRDDFFQMIDVLVSCSRMENLPYTVMEAMAWKRPVVASYVGGLPDLVEDGVTGYLITPNDPQSLADRMMAVQSDAALRRRMGEAGREKIQRDFSMSQCVDRHHDLYATLWKQHSAY